jgi:sulfur-oxidizing protein SoxY
MSQDYSTRRQFLGLAGGAAVVITVPIVTLRPARATPAMLAAAIRDVVGEAVVRPG